jgi:hypothetical protein
MVVQLTLIRLAFPSVARTGTVAMAANLRSFAMKFPHESDDLVAVVMGDGADFLVGDATLTAFRPLLEDAQDAGLGSFPVDPALRLVS